MMIYLFNLINDEYKLVIGNYEHSIEGLYLSLHRLLGPTCILMRENAPSAIISLVVRDRVVRYDHQAKDIVFYMG